MYRASTPTHKFRIPISRTAISDFLLTYADGDTGEVLLEFRMEDAVFETENTFSVTLTQEQTNAFKEGIAVVQLRVKSTNGKVLPSNRKYIDVRTVLNDEVI
jgi:transcriptional/translational regulatory protein YebC/TACO1